MSNESYRKIACEELNFCLIRNFRGIEINSLDRFDAVIIDCSLNREDAILAFIEQVQSHENESIYLMPIYLAKAPLASSSTDTVQLLADGKLENISNPCEISERVRAINERIP